MTLREQVQLLRDDIVRSAADAGANRVRLVGSVSLVEEHPGSDIDMVVTLERGRTFLDLARLEARFKHCPADASMTSPTLDFANRSVRRCCATRSMCEHVSGDHRR